MYNNSQRFQSARSGGPQGRSRFGGPRRPSYGNGGSRRFGNRRKIATLDYTKFVKKASPKKIEEYTPIHKFNDFKISDALKRNIAAKEYVIPTPIQDKTISEIIDGKDVIGIANTGTGKTAAFLIPLINKVQLDRYQKILIMVPTRELANQINDEFRTFAGGLGVYATTVIGGESIYRQMQALRRKPHFVVGTPGRIKDLEERGVLVLSQFQNIVLDEVDRMVDMGFIQDIRALLAKLPEKRQSLFFSATMSSEVESLTRTFLHNPLYISVKTQATADNIDQDIVRFVGPSQKMEKLEEILGSKEVTKTLIFVRTKISADKLDNELAKRGFKSTSIHGNKSQYVRQKSLNKFKEGYVDILVATDVAARGLDIPNVSHVINYDAPENYDDYVHRIGRTGRGNKSGVALTFVG